MDKPSPNLVGVGSSVWAHAELNRVKVAETGMFWVDSEGSNTKGNELWVMKHF